MIGAIDDHQEISMMIERQTFGPIKEAIITAFLDGTNRDLDSSIHIITVWLIEMIAHDCNTNSTNTKTIYSANHSNNNKISID